MLETRPPTSTEVRASVVLTSNVPKAWDTPPRQHKAAPAVKRMLRARPLAGTWRHYAVLRSRAALLEVLVKDGGGCTWQGEQATRQCRMAGNKLIATSKGTKAGANRQDQIVCARSQCRCRARTQRSQLAGRDKGKLAGAVSQGDASDVASRECRESHSRSRTQVRPPTVVASARALSSAEGMCWPLWWGVRGEKFGVGRGGLCALACCHAGLCMVSTCVYLD